MKYQNTTALFVTHLANANALAGDGQFLATALAFEVQGEGDEIAAPDWVQIFPKGPTLAAMDGRFFKMSDPQVIIDRHIAAGKPIMVDYDHLSTFGPDKNGDQTAAGWIEELELRDGEIWAKVTWTVRAAQKIKEREYRFVSPEFKAHKQTGEVFTFDALALVNRPAFQMTALARSQSTLNGDTPMFTAIAKALGLSEDADEATILAAIAKKDSDHTTELAAQQTPSTEKYMPRADYNVVLARAEKAEGNLKDAATKTRKTEVETMIASAVKAGKITPGTKDHYTAIAMKDDAGFEEIEKLIASLTPVTKASGLNDEDKHMAATLNISEEDYAKQLAVDKG